MDRDIPIALTQPSKTDITSHSDVMGGEPVVGGTRVLAMTIAVYLAAGWSEQEIFADYPSLPADGIDAVKRWQSGAISA